MGKGFRQLLVLAAIAAMAPACGGGGGGKTVPGTVIVNPISSITTEDGVTKASFSVVLGKKPKKDVTIAVSSSNTAEGDVDKSSLLFTKLNWNVPQTVTVTGADDFVADANVGYTIVLAPCVSADKAFNGVDPTDVPLTNNNDDIAGFKFVGTAGLTTTEDGDSASFTIELTSEPTSTVTVNLSSDNTNEGTVSPATLTFTAGPGLNAWNTPHTVTITGVNGPVDTQDGSVLYHIVFAAASGGGTGYDTVTPAQVDVTNTDNDSAGITANPSAGLVTNESGTPDTFTVRLNSQPTDDVTIVVTTSNAAAGLVSSVDDPTPATTLTLTFTAAAGPKVWNATQTVTVTGQNDALPTDNAAVLYNITLNPASVGDANYNGLGNILISATNGDDDVPGITVTPKTGLVTTEFGAGTDTFTVQLDTVPSSTVRLLITSSNTNEGTVDKAFLDFLPDSTALAPQTVTITGVQDLAVDGDSPYTITVSVDLVNTIDPSYTPLGDIPVNVTNNDDDSPGFVRSGNADSLLTSEPNVADSFTVALASIPSQQVTIDFTVDVPGEVSFPLQVIFPPTSAALTPVTVTVTGLDDLTPDGAVSFIITGTASSGDNNYDGLTFTAGGSNADDDVPPEPGSGPWTKPAATGIPVGGNGTWNGKSTQEPCVIKIGATFYMWFEGANAAGQKHEQIGYATSADGKAWTITATPVFSHTGVAGFDKNGVGDPSVYFDGATYHMWYAGRENAATKNKIGYATSLDGLTWTRQNGGNAVLTGTGGTFDAVGVLGPMVIKDGATYHMYYSGFDASGSHRIGHATSTDGVTWVKTVGPIMLLGTTGEFDAFATKLCGAIIDGTKIRMWYVGTDVTGPSGRQRIGLASTDLITPASNWAKFAGNPVMDTGAPLDFDERNLWSPWVIKDGTVFKMWYGGENNAGVIRIGYAEVP